MFAPAIVYTGTAECVETFMPKVQELSVGNKLFPLKFVVRRFLGPLRNLGSDPLYAAVQLINPSRLLCYRITLSLPSTPILCVLLDPAIASER